MLSVSGISESYLSQALYDSQGTSSSEESNDPSQSSNLSASDIVTLSSESLDLLKSLLNSTGDVSSLSGFSGDSSDLLAALYDSTSDETSSSGSQDLLSTLFNSTVDSSDSLTGSIYDILISAQNEKLIKNNPELVNMILDTDSTDSSSTALSTDTP